MAKIAKKSGTKADRIREILAAEPQTPTREVVEALATKGVKVSPNHVYLIKSKMKMKKRRQKREKAAAVIQRTGTPNPAQAVTKVKALALELGGLKNLKQLVDVLSE
jgi:transposase